MTTLSTMPSALGQEWLTLQADYEQYEKSVLLIKLVCVSLVFAGLAFGVHKLVITAFICVLWLQEGIFKTYQSRLGIRLLRVEKLIREATSAELEIGNTAFQLHTEWQASRGSAVGLIAEYAASAMKPTVAFPHAVLLAIAIFMYVA